MIKPFIQLECTCTYVIVYVTAIALSLYFSSKFNFLKTYQIKREGFGLMNVNYLVSSV